MRKFMVARAQRRQVLRLIAPAHANWPKMMNVKPPFAGAPDAVGAHVGATPTISGKHRVFLLSGEWRAVLRNLV